ncbi:RCC1 and BTB domain-containing protein 1-like isoform X2 [Planococcus citri]|uniref:RCC1 and BTB domain-containing protein 1-like isoform X2 n=1 Tax=Planococcus citri TaxID=170843 RepID=UPI0031F783FE
MDIRKYFCEWKFRDNFIEQIETFAVWRDADYFGNALIITKNHEVYAAGSFIDNCSKYSSNSNSKTDYYEPVKLSLLSGERIKKFVYGERHIFICTEKGEVFGFGNSFNGTEYKIVSPQKVPSLLGLNVVDIAIGPNKQHLALCDNGKLYKFEFTSKPRKYLINTSAVKAKPLNIFHVEKGFCISLLDNGKVMKVNIDDPAFSNSNVSERRDDEILENYCELMIFQNYEYSDRPNHSKIKITKLIGGYTHALAVDEHGRLFVTGHDYKGQLGLGGPESNIHYGHFKQNSLLTEKVVDIAASFSWHLSAALTESGKVYIWGEGRGPKSFEPQLTAFESLHEVFLYYSTNLETYKPINVNELSAITFTPMPIACSVTDAQNFLINSFKNAFDDPKFCDLFVVVEGKTIPVHKSILAVRCEHFGEIFQKDWPIEKPRITQLDK